MSISIECERIIKLRELKSSLYLNTSSAYLNNPVYTELDKTIDAWEARTVEAYQEACKNYKHGVVYANEFLISYPVYEDGELSNLLWLVDDKYAITVIQGHLEIVENNGKLLENIANRLEILVDEGCPLELESPNE